MQVPIAVPTDPTVAHDGFFYKEKLGNKIPTPIRSGGTYLITYMF